MEAAFLSSIHASLEVHLISLGIAVTLGTFGNGSIIYVYFKKNTNDLGNIFVLTLAMIDLAFCYILPPYFLIIDSFRDQISEVAITYLVDICLLMVRFFLLINLEMLCIMALERLWAVLKPFSFQKFRKKTYIVVIATVTIALIEAFIATMATMAISVRIVFAHVFLTLLIILVTYPVIIIKLFKWQQVRVGAAMNGTGLRHETWRKTVATQRDKMTRLGQPRLNTVTQWYV